MSKWTSVKPLRVWMLWQLQKLIWARLTSEAGEALTLPERGFLHSHKDHHPLLKRGLHSRDFQGLLPSPPSPSSSPPPESSSSSPSPSTSEPHHYNSHHSHHHLSQNISDYVCLGYLISPKCHPHLQHKKASLYGLQDGLFILFMGFLFSWVPKSVLTMTAATKLKIFASWKKSYDRPRQSIKKQA